ncbi:MAG TPA: DivIVA domain-containing protein [bacterium]|nr:DivIVA domain-containing protein [bacterium]HPR88748.1 DivIVA domain-containing protein [bacterium]
MKLTPLDIRKQEFKKSMRGYDPEEVEAFLIMVADELELLLRDKNLQSDELIKLRTQLRDYQQVEHTLRETLMKATSTVEESRFNSLREAELRIHEAELQAEKIIEQAKEELQELHSEINLLRAQKESFSRRLRHLLESQIELLDVLGIDDAMVKQGDEQPGAGPALRGRLPRPVLPAEPEAPTPHPPAQTPPPAPTQSSLPFPHPAAPAAAPSAAAAPAPAFAPTPAPAPAAPLRWPAAESPAEPFPPRPDGPRIVRGERRFDTPTGMRMVEEDGEEETRDREQNREPNSGDNTLSDQIVI